MGEKNQVVKRALAKLDIAINKKKFKGEVENYSSHSDQSNNYTLELDVGIAAHVSCMIRTDNKMMIIRSESTPDGMSQQDLDELGNEIIEKIGAKKTSYDGVLAIMKAVAFKNLQDEDAEKLIFNEVMAFVQNLIIYKNRLQGQPEDGETEGFFDNEEENDPFGFNSILTDEEGNPFDEADNSETSEASAKIENKNQSEEKEKEGPKTPAAGSEKVQKEVKALDNPDIKKTLDTISGNNEDDKKLSEMLKDFKKEEPLDLEPVDIKDLVPVTQVVDVAEQEIPDDVDIFKTVDAFHGSDQYGLVERTRKYKDAAQTALDQIHDILASLYSPVYKLSLDLYSRNDQLMLNERNVQQTLNNLAIRQQQIDQQEAQILEQQQALLRDRANFNQYRESIRNILTDYDIKCRLVNEQADELRKLRYSLSGQMGRADQLQRQLDAMMSGKTEKVSKEYAEAILKANDKLQEQMEKLKERLNQCYQIIDAFQACQENWNKREEEYKKLIYDLGDSTTLSDTAKEEIEKAQERIRELEVAVANQTHLAEEQSALAQEQRSRADDLETNEKKLKSKLLENEQKAEDMEKRAETAEKQLANEQLKSDVTQNAIKIRDQLKTIGVDVEAVPGEEMVFNAIINGCQIVVNVEISVIYINKELKKPQKYKAQIDDLNKQDIRTSYTIGDKYINCRTMYTAADEVAVQVEEILENMNSLQ